MKEPTMTRRSFIAGSVAALATASIPGMTGCSTAQLVNVPELSYPEEILLVNCSVVDVVSGKLLPAQRLLVRRGRIAAMSREIADAEGRLTIDCRDGYILPGFIDAHCHTTISPVFAFSVMDLTRHLSQQKRHYELCIETGITTVRDTGAFPGSLHGFMGDIAHGRLKGPRVIYCNSILNIRGGHPDVPPSDLNVFAGAASLFIGMVMTNFDGDDDLRRIIDENCEGASFIKLTMDNRSVFCRKGDIAAYSDTQLASIFDEAGRRGLPVAAHSHRLWGFDRIMKYPVHSIEHITSDAELTDDRIGLMARKKVSIVPTMTVGQAYLMDEVYENLPGEFREDFISVEMKHRREYLAGDAYKHCDPVLHRKNLACLEDYRTLGMDSLWARKKFLVNPFLYYGMIHYGRKNLLKMRDAGINIGCAIDAGMPFSYFGGLYREFELYSRIGFSNAEILACATINNARILRMEDSIGSIGTGKFADLVIVRSNPLADITACRKPAMVIREGHIVHSDQPFRYDAAKGRAEIA